MPSWRGDPLCWASNTVCCKGSEGSKETKHTTCKLTPWWFQKCKFFENLPTPFFGNVGFVKFSTFSALLALPVRIRDGYGQIVYETLPHILLSNASLVTKSCIGRASLGLSRATHLIRARWVTAARVPLPHWRTQSRPYRHPGPAPAVYSPAYLAAFARFANKRLIVVGKFECNVKYHLSMSSKLGLRVPRWKRNDTFLRAFVKKIALTWPLQWETVPETVLAGPGAAAPRPAVSRCGRPRRGGGGGPTWPVNHQRGRISSTVSDIEPPDEG